MLSGNEIDLSALVARLENEIEAEFPGWLISRESSGRWTAVRPDWGLLYGDSAPELRARLRRYASGDGVRDA